MDTPVPISKVKPNRSDWIENFDDSLCLDWLFDPERIDHLPIEEQLKYYKQRNLRKTKLFKIASNIWGAPLSRKRLIIAQSTGQENENTYNVPINTAQSITSQLKPNDILAGLPLTENGESQSQRDTIASYKKWIEDRKAFRSNLDNMGLTEEYLTRKPNKTALEWRVLRKILEEKYPKLPAPPPREDTPLDAIIPDDIPFVKRPSPQAIKIIEQFLQEKKLRLLDLFLSVDKDKNWKLTREEFRYAVKKAGIPISDLLLEDLILTLDTDLTDELDYRELAKGMGLWKREKRETKRKHLSTSSFSSSPTKFSQLSGFESPEKLERLNTQGSSMKNGNSTTAGSRPTMTKENPDHKSQSTKDNYQPSLQETDILLPDKDTATYDRDNTSNSRVKSAISTISTTSSKNLEPPDSDLRPEIKELNSPEAMVDLRKRNRESLSFFLKNKRKNSGDKKKNVSVNPFVYDTNMVIKTGEKAIDDHLMPSTLGGSTADQVNRFRRLRYMEYHQICQLCNERNIVLSEALLQKVLLNPPDRPHKDIMHQIRQPANPLFSVNFAAPKVDKNSYTTPSPDQEVNKQQVKKVKVSKEGKVQVLVDSRALYPPRSKVAAIPVKMNLSSGKAVIRRQVDCWLTYEEYEKLTRTYATRFVDLHGHSDDNAFWPGHLLNKIAMYMPDPTPLRMAIFSSTKQQPRSNYGYDNDLRTFPVSNAGYVKYGVIEK